MEPFMKILIFGGLIGGAYMVYVNINNNNSQTVNGVIIPNKKIWGGVYDNPTINVI
jgi:hypothetical protein